MRNERPREDVADLLRAGRTYREIEEQLGVSRHVITATRRAYEIPTPTSGPGRRHPPEERAEIERRTIGLLLVGASYAQIKEQVGITAPTIVRIRREAGLGPSGLTGGHPARSVTQALAEHVEPYGDGHARWTGPMAGRMPQLCAEAGKFNARHAVFEQHHGRRPVGYVRATCGVLPCMAGAHLADDLLRQAQPKEAPVTVQALKNLLDEIDEQGGPQAARDNHLHLPQPTSPTAEEPTTMTTTSQPTVTTPAASTPSITQKTAEVSTSAIPVGALLKWGDEHPDPEVQDQAARARIALHGLRQRHATDQELTMIATKREELEKQLADLTAREAELAPAKPKKTRKPVAYPAAEVRAWAKENSIDCPATGRVPKTVVDAWHQATSPASRTS